MISKTSFNKPVVKNLISESSKIGEQGQHSADLYIYHNSDSNCNHDVSGKAVISDHYKIMLITGGFTQVQLNHTVYDLPVNSLFIVPPDVVHNCYEIEKGSLLIGMGFTLNFLITAGMHIQHEEMFDFMYTGNYPCFLLKDEETVRLSSLMALIKQKYTSKEKHFYKSEVLYHGFKLFMFELASILKMYRTTDQIKCTRKEDILMIFLKLLSQHFKEERSVQYYAGLICITSKHLTKTVKELTNKPCRAHIDEIVIKEAKVLLDDLSLPVSRVAALLHFSDQFFFSKFFKKQTGTNPSRFKRGLYESDVEQAILC